MSDSNKSEAIPPTTQSGAPVDTASTAPKQRGGGKGLSVFAVLLSLAALGASGYMWFEGQVSDVQENSRLAIGVSEIGTQVSRLGDHVARLQQDQSQVVTEPVLSAKLLEYDAAVKSQISVLEDQQQSTLASVQKLSEDLQRGVDKFVVEEVSQLLRLANNSVLFGNDIEAASNALMLADTQLKGLKDPRYGLVRTQINTELAALAAVALPDIDALTAQLSVLRAQISQLPLANEPESKVIETSTSAPSQDTEELTFRGELVKIWRDLIGSISIQRVDQPPKPLLVPEQRYFLNENIGLALSKAELALLQGKAEVFQRSVEEARQWLNEYFDLNDAAVQQSLNTLDALRNSDIEVVIPPITGSYQALQTILGGQ